MLAWILAAVGCAPVPVDPTGRPFDAVTVDDEPGLAAAAEVEAFASYGTVGLGTLPTIPDAPTAEELAEANPPPATAELGLKSSSLPMPSAMATPAISPTAVDLNWDPAMPTRDSAFGVHLVGTMVDADPPNAVLRLPSGQKTLVEAGQMLDDDGLLVLAVGDRVVKVVKVTKQGWYAKVETAVLHSNPKGRPTDPGPARRVAPRPAPVVPVPAPASPAAAPDPAPPAPPPSGL
ncbi:MAG: hypothetical protein AAF602_19275 [Myxococcota bacterium]